jgi:hypothetical protein
VWTSTLRSPQATNFVLYLEDGGVFTAGMYVIAHSTASLHSLHTVFRKNHASGRFVAKRPSVQSKSYLTHSSRECIKPFEWLPGVNAGGQKWIEMSFMPRPHLHISCTSSSSIGQD